MIIKKSSIAIALLLGVNSFAQTTVSDIDGNTYNTITIGTQTWMKENLKVTRFNNGDLIPNNTSLWGMFGTAGRCYYNNDSVAYAPVYGALYNYFAITDSRNLCPSNWHVATNDEWTILEREICTHSTCEASFPYNSSTNGWRGIDEGSKLKEVGTANWQPTNTGATNSTGFTALPGGFRVTNGGFSNVGATGIWWALSFSNSYRQLNYDKEEIYRGTTGSEFGLSVRCLSNSLPTKVTKKTIGIDPLEIYPNPVVSKLIIDNANDSYKRAFAYNSVGMCVLDTELKGGINELNVDFLAKGVYILFVTGDNVNVSKKIIKE